MKNPGKTALFFLVLFLTPAMTTVIALADLSDPCESTGGPGQYTNFIEPDADYISWSNPPDETYLCQKSNGREASVVYHVPGARRVEVALYSRYGSYADQDGEGWVRGGEDRPLRYHASSDEVYCGDWRMVYDAELGEFSFVEEEAPSGLSRYGLSVYVSTDGDSYHEAPVELISAETEGGGAYYYEVYQAELDEGSNYIRLTLTDQSSIQILGREERYHFESTGGLSLASVEVEGDLAPDDSWEEMPAESSGSISSPSNSTWEEPPDPVLSGPLESQPEPMERPEWENGPAFEEEIQDETTSSQSSASQKASASSGSGGGSSASGKDRSETGTGEGSKEQGQGQTNSQEGEENGMVQGRQLLGSSGEAREKSFWERALEPDAMTLLLFSAALIIAALRILWKKD